MIEMSLRVNVAVSWESRTKKCQIFKKKKKEKGMKQRAGDV